VPHPLSGVVPLVANPIKYSRTRISYDAPPPLLGQHTDEVLSTLLGKTAEEIAALRAKRIV
jgi:crotonobetainyl-CoA:carnitine CoA-transferase CaiB-like acyl-CoA transferase